MVPEGLATIAGAAVGRTVGAGADVGPVEGTAVGAAVVEAAVVGAAGAVVGNGVAVADEPQAKITASKRVNGPRMIAFGFFNQ